MQQNQKYLLSYCMHSSSLQPGSYITHNATPTGRTVPAVVVIFSIILFVVMHCMCTANSPRRDITEWGDVRIYSKAAMLWLFCEISTWHYHCGVNILIYVKILNYKTVICDVPGGDMTVSAFLADKLTRFTPLCWKSTECECAACRLPRLLFVNIYNNDPVMEFSPVWFNNRTCESHRVSANEITANFKSSICGRLKKKKKWHLFTFLRFL